MRTKLWVLLGLYIFWGLALPADPPQIIIAEGLHEAELSSYLVTNYKTTSTMGYNTARDTMYAVIDIHDGDQLTGVYSGYTITLDLSQDPSTNAYQQGINCEHTWPQSMGAGSEPQKSDMHHLYPSRAPVNSSRGNAPFGEIPDDETDKWWIDDTYTTSIPTSNIDGYSERRNSDELFEPREEHKGNVARSMFYFYTMYQDAANENFFECQKEVLYQWHQMDPVDDAEYARSLKIASYQDDCANPFVLDSTLVRRIWFYDGPVVSVNQEPEYYASIRLSSYPNPGIAGSSVSFAIPQNITGTKLTIYNVRGQKIVALSGTSSPGMMQWNGKTSEGDVPAAGVYFYTLSQQGTPVASQKFLIMK